MQEQRRPWELCFFSKQFTGKLSSQRKDVELKLAGAQSDLASAALPCLHSPSTSPDCCTVIVQGSSWLHWIYISTLMLLRGTRVEFRGQRTGVHSLALPLCGLGLELLLLGSVASTTEPSCWASVVLSRHRCGSCQLSCYWGAHKYWQSMFNMFAERNKSVLNTYP